MIRSCLLIACLFVISGCGLTPQGDFVRAVVRDKGAVAADGGIQDARWFMCEAATIGSVRRWIGSSERMWNAWNTLCSEGLMGLPAISPPAATPDVLQAPGG